MNKTNKFLVYFAECDNPYAVSIFEIDTINDKYVKCYEHEKYSVGSEQEKLMLLGEYGTPSEFTDVYEDCLFDTLEEAKIARNNMIENNLLYFAGSEYDE